jgi:hypothetical protein
MALAINLRGCRMAMIEVRFSLEKETKGALGPHQEVDDKGEVIEQPCARIGTLYIARACSSVMRYSRRSCA